MNRHLCCSHIGGIYDPANKGEGFCVINICITWAVAMTKISHRIDICFFGERLINSLKKLVSLIREEIDKAARKC